MQYKTLSAALLLLSSFAATAGTGYEEINPPLNTLSDVDQVEVIEYFWFGCPHCFAFEPTINEWIDNKPDHADFRREAPPLNPGWMDHSKAFYAAELMGVTSTIFEPMFNAIHVEKRKLRKAADIAKFVGELGVDSDEFLETMNSFVVLSRIKQAMRRATSSGITGVPSIVINGKYRTGNSVAGGHEGIVKVINELVELEHVKGS